MVFTANTGARDFGTIQVHSKMASKAYVLFS